MPILIALLALCLPAAEAAPDPSVGQDRVMLASGRFRLPVSLRSPRVVLDDTTVPGDQPPAGVTGSLAGGGRLAVAYAPAPLPGGASLETKLSVQWSAGERVLRKWAALRVMGVAAPVLLKEVVLEEVSGVELLPRQAVIQPPFSYPVFFRGFFAGIEFPVSATRLERGRAVIAHQPGVRMHPGRWYQTRKAVLGVVPPGAEWQAFGRYVDAHRPAPRGRLINYNHWWSTPVRAAEPDILALMLTFHEKLYRASRVGRGVNGVRFDTFCIDVGWQDPKSIWEMDPTNFPAGFARARKAAGAMGTRLGIWVSPSSVYPQATDLEWAKEQGYETLAIPWGTGTMPGACLAGPRYQARFRQRIDAMVRAYGLGSIKFDGCLPTCPAADHGHEPGALSAEPIAEGIIDVFAAARKANPGIWLRPTCFGWNPSPWWLFYTNSAIGTHGDDAPYGRVPAPAPHESYTTARDYFNLQSASWSTVPQRMQEVLGIVHQTDEPFLNDAVMTVLRGHEFLPLYLNPKLMSACRWRQLARLLQWSRANTGLLHETVPLPPASWQGGRVPGFTGIPPMPREPYGYAYFRGPRGLVALRNPWIRPQTYRLRLDGSLGLARAAKGLSAVSLYPEPRIYGTGLRSGGVLAVPLAPYETVVLAIGPERPAASLRPASAALRDKVTARVRSRKLTRVTFVEARPPSGPSWTSLVGDAPSAIRLTLDATVEVSCPRSEVLVLLEGERSPEAPVVHLGGNGRRTAMRTGLSDAAWAASGLDVPEHWTFLRAPLPRGRSTVSLEVLAGREAARVSAWVWGTRAGGGSGRGPNALPEPEVVSLDAAPLLEPMATGGLPADPVAIERPAERIQGVYLDSLEPASITQGWGTLQRNLSVWEKPLVIGQRHYLRGIGVSSQTRITYALQGRYRRFQAWVGADHATNPTVTFEVWTDGHKRWESGLMERETPAKRVDVDLSGAATLDLVVGDAGNGIVADHADWADAKLLY